MKKKLTSSIISLVLAFSLLITNVAMAHGRTIEFINSQVSADMDEDDVPNQEAAIQTATEVDKVSEYDFDTEPAVKQGEQDSSQDEYIETTLFSIEDKSDNNCIISESSSKKAEASLMGSSSYFLNVSVLDMMGNPMVGADVLLVEQKGSAVRCMSELHHITESDGTTKVFVEKKEGYTYGIIVYGHTPDPSNPDLPWEPFFTYISFDSETNLTVNMAEHNMKKVEFQSLNKQGSILYVPHYNAIYIKNQNGLRTGLLFNETDYGRRTLWLPYGDYEYQTFVNSTGWGEGWQENPLYYMTENIYVDEQMPDSQILEIGGSNLIECLFSADKGEVTPIQAFTLFSEEGSMSPVFYHTMAQGSEILSKKILITPGTYKAQGVYTCYEQSGSWNLWIENELELQENGSVEWTAGSTFSAEITAEENIVGNLETIEFANNIYDEKGNRLIAAASNFSFDGWEDYLNHTTDSTLNKYEVVPFIVIRDQTGKMIFRYQYAPDNYEILTLWQSWSADNGTISNFPEDTTFFKGSYTIPEDLIEGEYSARLELAMGSVGEISAETNFTVISGPGIPVLDALISLTNSQSIIVSGKASLNSEVKVSYRLDGGDSIEVASTQTDERGRFEVTLTLPSEGEYKIIAVAVKSGETGMESTPVTVVVDRTAPGIPKNVEGFSLDEETIHITWEASEGGAVSYEILRNGSLVGTVSFMSENQWLYSDEGLVGGTEYEYEVIAVDSADNKSEPAKIKLTTQEPISLQITAVKWVGSWDNHNHLNAGTNLDITIVGTAEKTAKVIIEYMHSSGVTAKAEFVLPEINDENSQGETATYKGTVTIPDGAGSIEKITGVVFEDNNKVEMDTDGLPIPINGGLKVKMLDDTLTKLQGFNNAELSLWSNSKKVGEKVKIDGSSEYTLTGLIPSVDYELKLVNGSVNLGEYEDIEVIGGLMKEQIFSFNKAPATLELKILDEEGNAFYNTGWNVQYSAMVTIESSDNTVVAGGYPDYDGWVRSIGQKYSTAKKPIVNNGIEGETYRISVKVDRRIQDYISVVETVTLLPGKNVKNIILKKRPKAIVCGTVKNQDGDIISDAIITAYANAEDGSLLETQTTTDENGEYSLEVFAGKVYLRVMHTVSRTREYKLEAPMEKDEIREYHISIPIEKRIMVDFKYTSIGDGAFLEHDKFVQQLANITIKNTGREGVPKNSEILIQKGFALFYPVPVAEPGDVIEITVDETDYGYAKKTETVTLDENCWGRISMLLVEQGKIKVQFKDVYNKPIDYKVWATIYKQDDNNLSYVSNYEARFDEITSDNLEQGKYTVIFHTKAPITDYPYEKLMRYFGDDAIVFEDVLVEDNQITSLGLVSIEKKEETFVANFKAENGNEYRASDYEVAPGKLVTLTAKYSYSTTHPIIVDLNFFVDIPQGSTYIEDSLVVKPANNTKTPEVTLLEDNGKIDVIKLYMGGSVLDGTQIEEIEGVIIFQVRFTDNPESPWSSSRFWASFYNTSGGLNRFTQETIGEVLIKAPYVSISAPAFIKDRTVRVSGNAPKGSNIKIYDSAYLVGEAIVNHFGVWDTTITLPNRGDPCTHYLMAECFNNISEQAAYSNTVPVEYDTNRPIITKIVLTVNDALGETIEELKPNSKFAYTINYHKSVTAIHEIDIYFDDSSRIMDFELLSEDGSRIVNKESIIHYADENKFYAMWKGMQSVGEIRTSYRIKKEPWKISDYEPIEEDVLRSELPPLWGNATIMESANELLYDSEKDNLSMSSKVMLGDKNTVIETTMEISNYTGEIPAGYSADADLPIGNLQYEIREDDTFEITFIVPTELLLQEEILQQAQNFETKSVLSAASVVSLLATRVPNQLVRVFGEKTVLEAGLDIYSIYDTAASGSASNQHLRLLEELKKQVDSPCYHSPYQSDYEIDRDDIEWQQSRTQSRTVVKSILTVGFLALSFVPVGGWAIQLGIAVGTTIVGHLIDKHLENQQNKEYEALRARIDSRIRPECKEKKKVSDSEFVLGLNPRYRFGDTRTRLIDPSGYVYEGVESNRIEGVTASALVKVEEEWLLWDSEWTGQKNPLLTDSVGFYKWDVPEGWWKVMYEKEGYEIAFSEELPVPPPQLEVNVGIISQAPPSVTEIKAEHGGIINLIFDKYMQTEIVSHDTFKIYDEMTDDKGNNVLISGTITAVDAEPDPKNENVMFARTFQFISDAPMNTGDTCNVWVSKMVRSYADVTMSDDYLESVIIPEKVIEVESVSLNKTELTIHLGESVQLTAEVLPANADDISVSWSSDNPEIADVDNSGLVNANSKGTATITVTTSDGGFTDICLINVISKPASGHTNTTRNVRVKGIGIDKTELSLIVGGEAFKLSATIIPANAKNKNVVWSTSNKDVAVVENGMVKPVGEGNAIITVKTVDGNYSTSCNVIVKNKSNKYSETIGIETAEITAFDEEILLIFDTSTFQSETKVDMEKIIDKKDVGNLVFASSVFDIAFEGDIPAKPILLRMKYPPEVKIDPLKFGIYKRDESESTWSYIGGAIDTKNGSVQGTINQAGNYAIMAYEKTFTDILNHWSRKDIEVLTSRYVINGINENEFAPDLEITRAEFIKLIMSIEPLREAVETKIIQQSQTYKDVENSKWYFPYIEAATKMGIATGYDGFFRPDSSITREEMTVMVLRALNRDAQIKQIESDRSLSHFSDADMISDWALDYVTLATEKEIIQGDTNGKINPKGFTTRAEAAVVILRAMENLGFVIVPKTTKILGND